MPIPYLPSTHMKISKLAALYLLAQLSIVALSTNAICQEQSGIDLIELRQFAGSENVDGSGVNLLQVEAGSAVVTAGVVVSRSYTPNGGLLSEKTFEDIGTIFQSAGSDSHGTSVANTYSGVFAGRRADAQFGVAPAIGMTGNPTIKIISASEWLDSRLGTGNATPVPQNFDVSNHSYVQSLDPANGFDQAAAEDRLARLDFVINNGNMTTVVGTNNGNSSTPLPAGLVQAYNTINVGVTDGTHASGLTTLNTAGRNSIHVVADKNFTSFATPVVSGAASILHQTGAGTDATRQEVIKATILAGATKDEFNGAWSHTTTQPLDLVYGAGELNVLNNHLIQTGGEYNGGNSSGNAAIIQDVVGWDYELDLLGSEEMFYQFAVGVGDRLEDFSVALTWNRAVSDGNANPFVFDAEYAELANLSLELRDSNNNVVDFSNSALDNVEHIFAQTLEAGDYQLVVSNLSTNTTDFGLAFRGTTVAVPEPSAIALLGLSSLLLSVRRRRS